MSIEAFNETLNHDIKIVYNSDFGTNFLMLDGIYIDEANLDKEPWEQLKDHEPELYEKKRIEYLNKIKMEK